MPYYVFRLDEGAKDAQRPRLLKFFDGYRDARDFARTERAQNPELDAQTIRVVFAESPELAEHLLLQPREAPILREWEK